MAKTDFKNVDEYIATFPEGVRAVLQAVRAAIKDAVPEAEESIGYQLPAYRLAGRVLIYFGGFKKHYSLFGHSDAVLSAFQDELGAYEISKGTIKLPLDEPVPVDLIGRIAKYRANENLARATKRRPTTR